MMYKLFCLFFAGFCVLPLIADDPDGVLLGWDFRKAGNAVVAIADNGKDLVVKNNTGKEITGTRYHSVKCNANSVAKLKFKFSGDAEISVGCHAYTSRNIWTGLDKGNTAGFSSAQPTYVEFNIPISQGAKGDVAAIRPYININDGGNLKIHSFECVIKTPEVPVDQMITGGTFPKYFERFSNKDGDFDLRILPSFNKMILDSVSTPFSISGVDALRISLVAEKDNSVVMQKTIPFVDGAIKAWITDIPKNLLGDYRVEGEYLDAAGQTVLRGRGGSSVNFMDLESGWYRVGEIKRNAHLPNIVRPYPMGQKVFHFGEYPFQKMDVSVKNIPGFPEPELDGKTVRVINRDYVTGDNALPEQIVVRQQEPTRGKEYENILAAPVSVLLNGKEMKKSTETVISKKDGIVYTGTILDNAVKIDTAIESDGVVKVAVELLENVNMPLQTLTVAVPVRKDIATLFHECTDVTYRRADRSKTGFAAGIGGHAGFVPQKKAESNVVWQSAGLERSGKGSFNPFVWLGDEDRGICFFGDTDRDFIVDESLSCQTIERFDDRIVLGINLVNRKYPGQWQARKIVFGLLATPVKLPPENFRGTIFPRWATLDKEFYKKLTNLRKIIEIGAGHRRFNAGTCSILPMNDDVSINMYKDIRQEGKNSTYMEYFCSDYINLSSPELAMYFSEWKSGFVDKYGMKNPSSWFKRSDSFSFPQASWIGMRRIVPSYLQYRLWCLEEKIKKIGAYSFYEDNIHYRNFFDPALGYGYFDRDGDARYQFDTWSLRDYYRKIAAIFSRNNVENLAGAHASAAMNIPAMTAAVYFIDGEQPGRRVINDSMDYVTLWKKDPEYLRAHILGRQFGIRSIFLSEIMYRSKKKEVNRRQTRAFLAVILPHDIAIWDGAMADREPVKAWHKVINDLDFFNNNPRLLPYWGSRDYRAVETSVKDLYVTGYRQPGQILLVLSNFDEEREVSVKLNTGNYGFVPVKFKDMENPEAADIKLENDILTLSIPKHDYRLVLLTK